MRALALTIAAVLVCAAPAGATRPKGKISYLSYGKRIRVMNADGSRDRVLARVVTPDFYSSWSPDGRRLAYIAQLSGVRVAGFPSGRSRLLPQDAVSPMYVAWSPDGTTLAFIGTDGSTSGAPPTLFVMRSNGTGLRQLPLGDLTGSTIADVMWSADSQRVAFRRRDQDRVSIWAAPLSGAEPVKLLDSAGPDGEDEAYSWSPDNTLFVFERDNQLYVMNADGSGERSLNLPFGGAEPAWSPDGRWLAFTANPSGKPTNIYRVHADGTALKQLTHANEAYSPEWTVGRVRG